MGTKSLTAMTNKPKKWIAALLGLLFTPVGMLYVGRARLALGYFGVGLVAATVGFLFPAWMPAARGISALCAIVGACHGYLLAKRYPEPQLRPAYSRWYGLLGAAACVAVPMIALRAFFFEPFRAPSSSMLPTVPMGSHLIVQKWGYGNYGTYGLSFGHGPISAALARGDLVVFEFPQDRSTTFVKRLIGLPGDKIVYRGRQLFINGNAVPQRSDGEHYDSESRRYLPRFIESLSGQSYTVLSQGNSAWLSARVADFPFSEKCVYDAEQVTCDVPAGHFFVMGDNRDNSNDSRMWGFVPADHVVGKVVLVRS